MSTPTCAACGSPRIRRARMREGWQHYLKKHTTLRRYACGQCHHRGWTFQPLPHSDHPEEAQLRLDDQLELPGRPLERRDLRARHQHRLHLGKGVFVAVALGSLIALLIELIGRK